MTERCKLAVVVAMLAGVGMVSWLPGGAELGQANQAVAAPAPATAPADAATQAKAPLADMDSKYVCMEVPDKVSIGQVFAAKITMRNTGGQAWKEGYRAEGTLTVMVALEPKGAFTWGTGHIIQGQGSVAAPGKDFVYRSNLKAPLTPGTYTFQWQLKHGGATFGEPTERKTIIVEARENPPKWPSTLPAADPDGRRPLVFDDFEYLGSFKVPVRAGKGGAGFSALGVALRVMPDQSRRLLLNYTHPAQSLAEVEVPALVKLDASTPVSALNVPEVKYVWGAVHVAVPGAADIKGIGPNGGLWWNQKTQTLYWTWYHGYYTGAPVPILGASKLNEDGTVTSSGPWMAPNMKHHWGGVIGLPKAFADRYAGGRSMALGFGGYYSICNPCSRGPALGAIFEPDAARKDVDLLALLAYPGNTMAPRDGDYFNANCGYWDNPPDGPFKGFWAAFDECFAGVFIELPDRHAYIAFANLASGRIGYDYGAGTTGGRSQYWYFYDPADLGAAAKGTKKPAEVLPYLMAKDVAGAKGAPAILGGMVSGACFDPQQRRLYVVRTGAYPVAREVHPLIHVYGVKESTTKPAPAGG